MHEWQLSMDTRWQTSSELRVESSSWEWVELRGERSLCPSWVPGYREISQIVWGYVLPKVRGGVRTTHEKTKVFLFPQVKQFPRTFSKSFNPSRFKFAFSRKLFNTVLNIQYPEMWWMLKSKFLNTWSCNQLQVSREAFGLLRPSVSGWNQATLSKRHDERTTTHAHYLIEPTSTNTQIQLWRMIADLTKDYVAGVAGGVAVVLIGHPFDTVKTRLQTSPRGVYSGTIDCLKKTVRDEGMRGFYSGIGILKFIRHCWVTNELRWLHILGVWAIDRTLHFDPFLSSAVQ